MRSEVRLATLSLFLLASQAACDSHSKGSSGGDGAVVGGGLGGSEAGVTEPAEGDGGVVGTAAERIEACIVWKMAQCKRQIACGQPVHNCLAETLDCPDVLFSPGANWTPAQATACAQEFATLPCEVALQYRLPACAPSGARGAGQSCVFDSQCQSLNCGLGSVGSCYTCSPAVKSGESCYENGPCPPGDYCGKTETCTSYAGLPAGPTGPTLGTSCKDTPICIDASYCNGETCQPLPGKSMPCGRDPRDQYSAWCAEGLVCDRLSQTCVPAPGLDEKCVLGPLLQAGNTWLCASNLLCDERFTPPYKCRDYEGIACSTSWECGSERVCACSPDVSNVFCRSRDRTCRNEKDLLMAGAPCSPDRNLCHPAFSCTDGTCVPLEAQGYFTQLCKKK
jgi:hypothetical protein